MLTDQEMFNIVWKRAKIPARAVVAGAGICRLRANKTAEDPLRCFLGECIPDNEYNPTWDNGNTPTSVVLRECYSLKELTYSLVTDIQRIHDNCAPGVWEEMLREIAEKYDLTIPND